jgi:hypothetical protein
VQPFDEDRTDERLGIPARELDREPHERNALHPGSRERVQLLTGRHQQRRRFVRPEHTRWMRVERHRRGCAATLAGAPAHAVDNLHVPAMEPVEVAERQYRLVPAWRRVVGEMCYLHP